MRPNKIFAFVLLALFTVTGTAFANTTAAATLETTLNATLSPPLIEASGMATWTTTGALGTELLFRANPDGTFVLHGTLGEDGALIQTNSGAGLYVLADELLFRNVASIGAVVPIYVANTGLAFKKKNTPAGTYILLTADVAFALHGGNLVKLGEPIPIPIDNMLLASTCNSTLTAENDEAVAAFN